MENWLGREAMHFNLEIAVAKYLSKTAGIDAAASRLQSPAVSCFS